MEDKFNQEVLAEKYYPQKSSAQATLITSSEASAIAEVERQPSMKLTSLIYGDRLCFQIDLPV